MFNVRNDAPAQLLTVTYTGNVAVAEMLRCADEIGAGLAAMNPGFRVLADFTGMESMDTDCGPIIARIMDLCNAAGVGRICRVIPDMHKDIGVNILSYFHYGSDVMISTYEDLAAALKDLAG